MKTPPPITPLEMSETDIELCERAAKRIGFTQTAYTSSSGLWGLFCLPDHAKHRKGCFINGQFTQAKRQCASFGMNYDLEYAKAKGNL